MSILKLHKDEIPQGDQSGGSPPQKKGHKWYMRLIALILAVAMVISAVVYNNNASQVGDLTSASFEQEGEKVVLSADAAQKNMEAIKKAKAIQKDLSKDYDEVVSLIQEGKYEDAIKPAEELYTYLAEDETVGPYLRSTLSELYFMNGDYKKCAEICDDMIEREENMDGSIHFMDGISKMQTQNYEGAVKNLKEAINLGYSQPTMCKAQLALANMYLGKQDDAISYAEEVLNGEHDTSLDEILTYIIAVSHLQQGDYEEGIEKLDELIETSDNGEYYYYRGVGEMALKEYEEAEADFASALNKDYDQTACYYNYGICLCATGDAAAAKEALNVVVTRDDDDEYTASAKKLLTELEEIVQ